jgi:Holliday junction resolvase RusA-like endonuclease
MAKRPLTLKVRLPPYQFPRTEWRKAIHEAVLKKLRGTSISYQKDDRLEIAVRLYLKSPAVAIHDVDNRLKDILDALQGHVGGNKKKLRSLKPIIKNDCQIWRVVIQKAAPPWQSHGLGHLKIRKLSVH